MVTLALVPAHHIQLVQELIDPGMVIVTLRSYEVQGSAVLSADLLHQVIRDFLGLAGGRGGGECRREPRGNIMSQ